MTKTGAQRGAVLIWALLFVMITAGMVISHTTYLAAMRGERDARYNRASIAKTFGRSGLVETVGWFRRQAKQPVLEFQPQLDPHADPPRHDTMDPAIGLVREFEIHGNLWGRYEIRHSDARDISAMRGGLPPGSVWELGVRSFVFRLNDPDTSYDTAPNRLVATGRLLNEIRALHVNLPAPAAVCVEDPASITLGSSGGSVEVTGGLGAGIAYAAPASASITRVAVPADAAVTGIPEQSAVLTYDARPERVFAMRLDELRAYSDVIADSGDAVAGDRTAVYVPRSVTTSEPIHVRDSLVVVEGDWRVTTETPYEVSGVFYVTGDAHIDGDIGIRGMLVVRGRLSMSRGSVHYDPLTVEKVRRSVGQYRLRRGRSAGEDDVSDDVEDVDEKEPATCDPQIDATATVRSGAKLGSGVVIGADATIGLNASVGDRSFVEKSYVWWEASIGQDVKVTDGSSVGNATKLGDGVVMEGASVSHGGEVGAGSVLERGVVVGNNARIGRNVTIGEGARIGDRVTIRDGATVPPGAVIPSGSVYP